MSPTCTFAPAANARGHRFLSEERDEISLFISLLTRGDQVYQGEKVRSDTANVSAIIDFFFFFDPSPSPSRVNDTLSYDLWAEYYP
jgi:hypothetical protein